MQTITDWPLLWKELVELKKHTPKGSMETPGEKDMWRDRARDFNERVKQRWDKPDSTRKLMLNLVEPGSTILDIGAGTGAWALFFSKYVHKVTAVEPSSAMREVLHDNILYSKAPNIEIIPEKWQNAYPEVHDYAFCSHAMYGVADFPAFVQHMIDCASKMCFLLIRSPVPGGLITEAFEHIYNQPHDSPNFTIAYNILLQMGIRANVQIEDSDKWFFQESASPEEAFTELKNRMGLTESEEHDAYLCGLLDRRLEQRDGKFYWPGGVQSALVYWAV